MNAEARDASALDDDGTVVPVGFCRFEVTVSAWNQTLWPTTTACGTVPGGSIGKIATSGAVAEIGP